MYIIWISDFSFYAGGSSAKDVDNAEKIADFQAKILELEKQNSSLKNKVQVRVYVCSCMHLLTACTL